MLITILTMSSSSAAMVGGFLRENVVIDFSPRRSLKISNGFCLFVHLHYPQASVAQAGLGVDVKGSLLVVVGVGVGVLGAVPGSVGDLVVFFVTVLLQSCDPSLCS